MLRITLVHKPTEFIWTEIIQYAGSIFSTKRYFGPLYSNTVISTQYNLWVVCYIWYSEEGPGWATNFILFDVAL